MTVGPGIRTGMGPKAIPHQGPDLEGRRPRPPVFAGPPELGSCLQAFPLPLHILGGVGQKESSSRQGEGDSGSLEGLEQEVCRTARQPEEASGQEGMMVERSGPGEELKASLSRRPPPL